MRQEMKLLFSCCAGTDSDDIARSDDEAALSVQLAELQQEQPYHSSSANITNPPTEANEKTTHHRVIPQTSLGSPVQTANKEHQESSCVEHETPSHNILPLKSVDKGSSPIDIPTMNPLGRGTSSDDSVENIYKTPSVSIPEKTCVDRDSSPVNIPSATIIPNEKSVNKSTSPVIFLSPKDTVPPCNDDCTDSYMCGIQVADPLRGIALCKVEVATNIVNMHSTQQQTVLPEQTGTLGGASKIHPETQHSSENKVEPLDISHPADIVKRTDTETQTDADAELNIGPKEKIKEKKHQWLACGQNQLPEEPNSASFIQQELLSVQEEVIPYSSVSSSPHANTTEMTCKTPSLSSVSNA
jgi:hypothetical protein